jgi:uncharacterized protein YjbI with pentapeptide repeats
MEVLTAYVRDNAPWPPKDAQLLQDDQNSSPKPAIDIQAVLTVLGRRTRSLDRERWNHLDLAQTDLRGATLDGAHLEGVNFQNAHLEGATLYRAHLERAFLYGVHLESAVLFGAHLEGANLQNAHLEGATLSMAHLEGAEYLTVAQLATVSFLVGAFLDPSLMEQLQREQPRLVSSSRQVIERVP